MYKKIVVVGADMMSSIIDYQDRSTCIIFGDGAGAVLLERGEEGEGFQEAVLRADGAGREFLYMEAGGSKRPPTQDTVKERLHFVHQEGRTVFKSAVKQMSKAVQDLLSTRNLTVDHVDWLIPHQANLRIIQTVASMTGIPMDKVFVNIQRYGNTTAATLPLCLWDFEKRMKKGDRVVFTAFGGGFTWGACDFIWAYDKD